MTAKLSKESIALIMKMFHEGSATVDIAKAVDCAPSTVVRHLNAAGIVIGNTGGRPKELTPEYLAMALEMKSRGCTWMDVEAEIGFHRKTFQGELRAQRNQACAM